MAFIPVNEVVRAAFNFVNADGNEAVNVQHFKGDEIPITPTVLNELAIVIETWAETSWVDAAAAAWTFQSVELLDLTTEDSYYLNYPIGAVGAAPGDALPSNATIAVSLRTAFAGRSNRGRLYHVGLSEGMAEGDYINSAGRVTLLNTYNQLRSDMIANEFTWGVVSYVENGVPRIAGSYRPYTSVILVDDLIDRQNRRRPNP